jgi:hypothetical protein
MKLVSLLMFVSGILQAQSDILNSQVFHHVQFTVAFNAAQPSASKPPNESELFVQEELHHKLFWSSVVAFGLSSGFDYATSIKLNDAAKRGLVRERNAFLRNSYGGFDPAKGLLVKGGARAVLVVTEVVLRRKLGTKPRDSKLLDRSFTVLNYALSGFFVRIGVSNIQLGQMHGVY